MPPLTDGSNEKNERSPGSSPDPSSRTTSPAGGWLWFILLFVFVNWFMAWLSSRSDMTEITYSQLLDQIGAGNLKTAQFQGYVLSGTFKKAVILPASVTPASKTTPKPFEAFSVNLPPDSAGEVRRALEQHQVPISAKEAGAPWYFGLLSWLLPLGLMWFVWMGVRQVKTGMSGAPFFGFGQSRARVYSQESPRISFDDVAGEEESKQELTEIVDFLRHPGKYHKLGGKIPKGVLLVGPPGTGKTLLARAVAGEAGVPFFSISASEFVEMFVGVGASRVRDLFEKAKASAPSIVFLDEIDAVGRQRGAGLGGGNDEREQTLNQLLVEMDGFDPKQEVIVIAATNRPDVLDPALLRPGRFDRQVAVGLPDRQGREGILTIHTRHVPLSPQVNLNEIARGTPGMVGADLANLVNEAALTAARRNKDAVDPADFDDALDKIVLGVARSTLMSEEERRTVAYHESGHAIVAMLLPDADPVHKVTIIPHGLALGVTEQLPVDDRRNYPRPYLEARLCVMLGGRSAEEIALHQVTTGAENDLKEATRLARQMVVAWGMSDKIGNVAFRVDEMHPFLGREMSGPREYSEATAALIDAEVRALVEHAHDVAVQLLSDHRCELDALVDALLKEETVGHDRLQQLVEMSVRPT